ncbi:MAG: GntR family transcriptional regulator [Chloroflexi bacterium]|nr:GntR family transcriptional regulator [Chloroflexota bacterium]
MSINIDRASPIPLYYQIREQLREQIAEGILKPGDALPTEEQICTECGVSRMTARLALTQLANEGLVVRRQGKGTFVAAPKAVFTGERFPLLSYTEILQRLGLRAGAHIRSQEVVPASPGVARQLQLAVGEPVVKIVRLRLADGEPMSLETSFYPHHRFPTLAEQDLTNHSIYRLLEKEYHIVPAYAVETTELSVSSAYEAEALGIREGVPIVLCTRLSFDAEEKPIEFTHTAHRGDRFRSVVRLSRQQLGETLL